MEKQYDEKKTREMYERITGTLIRKGLTITTMESATSGQIASLITDREGSSAVRKGAFVTYCNEAKRNRILDFERWLCTYLCTCYQGCKRDKGDDSYSR